MARGLPSGGEREPARRRRRHAGRGMVGRGAGAAPRPAGRARRLPPAPYRGRPARRARRARQRRARRGRGPRARPGTAGGGGARAPRLDAGAPLTTYVLVHGAWAGSWKWRFVAPILRRAGHEVFTPTLTGLGERAHLASPD